MSPDWRSSERAASWPRSRSPRRTPGRSSFTRRRSPTARHSPRGQTSTVKTFDASWSSRSPRTRKRSPRRTAHLSRGAATSLRSTSSSRPSSASTCRPRTATSSKSDSPSPRSLDRSTCSAGPVWPSATCSSSRQTTRPSSPLGSPGSEASGLRTSAGVSRRRPLRPRGSRASTATSHRRALRPPTRARAGRRRRG